MCIKELNVHYLIYFCLLPHILCATLCLVYLLCRIRCCFFLFFFLKYNLQKPTFNNRTAALCVCHLQTAKCHLLAFAFAGIWTCMRQQRVSWKKLAGRSSQALLDVVSRLDQGPGSSGKSQKFQEDPKARRKRLYRLASEEKPSFPFQQKNFYMQVMENKEIVKILSLLSTCTQSVKLVNFIYL